MQYKIIEKHQSKDIAQLAICLINEIVERTGEAHFELDKAKNISLCEHYVSNGLYHVMAAFDGDEVVGFASMCERHSLYAEGSFCIIQEFYVMPDYRSKKVGTSLMEAVKQYSQAHNWKRIELCTPPVSEFERSVDFYEANGFEKTGGYKMKSIIV